MSNSINGPDPVASADAHEPPSSLLHEELFSVAERHPALPAIKYKGRRVVFEEYADRVKQMALGLRALGVERGTKVAIYLPNGPHYLISFFSVLAAGGVVVNLSPLDVEVTLSSKVADAEAIWIISLAGSELERTAVEIAKGRCIGLILGHESDFETQVRLAASTPEAGGAQQVPRVVHLATLLSHDPKQYSIPSGLTVDDLAVLQYTGGTTGAPKGAMLSHRNLSSGCGMLLHAIGGSTDSLLEGKERILLGLPLFHIFAMVIGMLVGVKLAAELIVMDRFDAGSAIDLIADNRVTMFPGVPTMFTALVNHPAAAQRDLKSLKFSLVGGAPIADGLARRFTQMTGVRILNGWGMTETSGVASITPGWDDGARPGSCGVPIPGIEVRVADLEDSEKEVSHGQRGQLCIKGPNVMTGYWRHKDASRAAFTSDGFLLTGDVGLMDRDGYIRIVDRTKDMIICSGYNVYPRVIEEAIYQHPDIEEVCVIGVPHDYRGQSPKAFIRLRTGTKSLDLATLQGFLQTRLGRHEMVHEIELREALPRTSVGKLSKLMLIDEEAARRSAMKN